jgi:4-hydroxybenzoate polyprenyltransferase
MRGRPFRVKDAAVRFLRRRCKLLPVLRAAFRLLRPHQWAKNLLVFFPLLTAHRLLGHEIRPALLAFAALCAVASAGYIVNDLADVESDRAHRTKSRRPVASGTISRQVALSIALVLLAIGIGIAIRLPAAFQLVLVIYAVLTTMYTFVLKRFAVVDVLTLAGLYTIRLFGGGEATGVPLSNWFLAFSMFLFLSLALVKRVGELQSQPAWAGARREYRPEDLAVLGRMGLSAGYLSVLVLALYINSSDVVRFYRHAERLWFLCGLLLYWISRTWLVTERREMHDDPVVFALTDRASYVLGALSVLVLYWAT